MGGIARRITALPGQKQETLSKQELKQKGLECAQLVKGLPGKNEFKP
jgi:hypothetical protein